MAELITEAVKGEPYQYYPLGEHVVRAVGVCGGRPTFKYTRIEITGTLASSSGRREPGYDRRWLSWSGSARGCDRSDSSRDQWLLKDLACA